MFSKFFIQTRFETIVTDLNVLKAPLKTTSLLGDSK